MRLSGAEIIDVLFDYTYNLGADELGNDEEIRVKMRFPTVEDQLEVQVGAEGRPGGLTTP